MFYVWNVRKTVSRPESIIVRFRSISGIMDAVCLSRNSGGRPARFLGARRNQFSPIDATIGRYRRLDGETPWRASSADGVTLSRCDPDSAEHSTEYM